MFQGKVTVKLLDDMGIPSCVLDSESDEASVRKAMEEFKPLLERRRDVAFVVRRGALSYDKEISYENDYVMLREEIIERVAEAAGEDPVVCTTGKASRELFEIRERRGQSHSYDFLTVGSMGHASSIALGIALNKSERRIWCVDGDGAVLMHMGAMAVLGSVKPDNLIHIVINNGAHETVGGMPTVAKNVDLVAIARGCGYPYAVCVSSFEELDQELQEAKTRTQLSFVEVKCAMGARADLGRPTTTALENKEAFMRYLQGDL